MNHTEYFLKINALNEEINGLKQKKIILEIDNQNEIPLLNELQQRYQTAKYSTDYVLGDTSYTIFPPEHTKETYTRIITNLQNRYYGALEKCRSLERQNRTHTQEYQQASKTHKDIDAFLPFGDYSYTVMGIPAIIVTNIYKLINGNTPQQTPSAEILQLLRDLYATLAPKVAKELNQHTQDKKNVTQLEQQLQKQERRMIEQRNEIEKIEKRIEALETTAKQLEENYYNEQWQDYLQRLKNQNPYHAYNLTPTEQEVIDTGLLHEQIITTDWHTQNEPLNHQAHPAQPHEMQLLVQALQIVATKQKQNSSLYTPDHFYIIDSENELAYSLGTGAYISRGYLRNQHYLPLLLAYVIAQMNTPYQGHIAMAIARHYCHSYTEPYLTSIRDVNIQTEISENLRGNLTERERMIGIKTNVIGTPEDIRPQPMDIVMGGGHNFTNLQYSTINFLGQLGRDTNIQQGLQALDNYLQHLPRESKARSYFANKNAWQKFFRQYQQKTDQIVQSMGFGIELLQLLQTRTMFIPTGGRDRINFHYSAAERIQYLRQF